MKEHKDIDYPLLLSILFLVIFGAITISLVSVYDSYRITRKLVEAGTLSEPNNLRFMTRNLAQAFIGMCGCMLAIKIPFLWWKKQSKFFYITMIVLLFIVIIPSIGTKINGARGWINMPGLPFLLQPTEFLKLSLILTLATLFSTYHPSSGSGSVGLGGGSRMILGYKNEQFIQFFSIMILPIILVMFQPDFGSLMIIIPIVVSMYFISGGNIRIILYLTMAGVIGASFLYFIGRHEDATDRTQFSYIYDRMNTFFQSSKEAIENNTMHHQNKQALIAIGSGGLTGLGFGGSIQKYGYLPEPQGDFIFSVIVEEWGFLGALALIGLYMSVIYRGFLISLLCPDSFGKYTAFGITVWIFWQMIVNMSVNLSIFPNTGLTLPFVSYGGSSLVVMLLAAGILLSISREIDPHKKNIRSLVPFLSTRRK